MEQIVRKNRVYYYGEVECFNVDDAYWRWREDYHKKLGRAVYRRLGRVGTRKERVHGWGFVYDKEPVLSGVPGELVPTRLLGLIQGSYCRMFGAWDLPGGVGDDEFDEWVEWALSERTRAVRMIGRKQKVGRTSKRLKKRYR